MLFEYPIIINQQEHLWNNENGHLFKLKAIEHETFIASSVY